MALPKRKHSNTRTRKRRTHQKIALPNLTQCRNCKTMILPHNACYKCGYYKGRKVDHTVPEDDKRKEEKK